MIEQGAVEEVEALLARKLDPDLPVMRAIGVREIAAYLRGELTLDEAIAAGQQATRRYAKRQYTWFAHQPPADWPRFREPLDERPARRSAGPARAERARRRAMDLLRDADIDPAPLAGKRVAILGYGNQGRAQALNLNDSGDRRRRRPARRLGKRDRGRGRRARRPRWSRTRSASADVVMMLAPDEIHGALYREIEPHLRDGAALGFSHGLSVRFGFVEPRADLDVFLVAPKGPGHGAALALPAKARA